MLCLCSAKTRLPLCVMCFNGKYIGSQWKHMQTFLWHMVEIQVVSGQGKDEIRQVDFKGIVQDDVENYLLCEIKAAALKEMGANWVAVRTGLRNNSWWWFFFFFTPIMFATFSWLQPWSTYTLYKGAVESKCHHLWAPVIPLLFLLLVSFNVNTVQSHPLIKPHITPPPAMQSWNGARGLTMLSHVQRLLGQQPQTLAGNWNMFGSHVLKW